MLPLVLNDDPSRLVEIRMWGSVGLKGANSPLDVRLVQSMLNNVPVGEGGPSPPLKGDGIVGQLTIDAIMRFQRAARVGVVDGTIEPGRGTIKALGRLLNSRSLMPRNVAGIGAPDERVRRGLSSAANVPTLRSISDGFIPLGPTDWTFKGGAGLGVGVDIVGITHMRFQLIKDSRPGFVRIFPFTGIGVGLSALPISLNMSFSQMPSWGSRLRQGMFNGANPMPEDDFMGHCNVISVGLSAGAGISGSLCLFGAVGPFPLPTRAMGFISGMEAGTPGLSITGYFGVVTSPIN